ncbi:MULTISPECIES: hypothetical protein [unclassified Microcoleus]|uniref:hypothetical protein n=1 Tax=unclassified Microcoleus TaxID=2642155 RepID=UPI002FD31060
MVIDRTWHEVLAKRKKYGVAKPEILPIPTLYLTPIGSQDIICVPKITYNGDCT